MTVASQNVATFLVVVSVQVVFASYQIMSKIAFQRNTLDPVCFAVVRLLGGALGFWFMAFLTSFGQEEHKKSIWPRPEHRNRFAGMGICMFGNVVGLVLALKFTTISTVAVLQVLRPVFAGVISWTLGIERPTFRQIVGLILCVLGAIAIVQCNGAPISLGHSAPWRIYVGAVLVCIHSFSIALYVVEQPRLIDAGYSAWAINASSYTFATVFCAGILAIPGLSPSEGRVWLPSDAFGWITIGHAVLLVGMYSYVAMAWAAKKLGGIAVMLFMMLQATLVLAVDHFWLHEVIYFGQVIGAILVLLGVFTYILNANDFSQEEVYPLCDEGRRDTTRRSTRKFVAA